MKKSFVLILFVFLLLNCVFAAYGNERNTYQTYVYSSKYTKNKMTKDEALFIIVNYTDFMLSRPLELELKNLFKEKGIKTYILTDYYDLEALTEEDLSDIFTYQEFREKNEGYVFTLFEIDFTDLYTYETGGGISKMTTSTTVYDMLYSNNKVKIVVQVVSDGNKLENYNSSWETVVKEMAKGIVDEYCKYLEPVSNK